MTGKYLFMNERYGKNTAVGIKFRPKKKGSNYL